MFKIHDKVFWVGIKDWELRSFHGEDYYTPRGSSYNSYLVKDEKVALVDTAWGPFKEEYVANLEKNIGVDNIDYVVCNHNEIDHSGSLAELIKHKPSLPIYCTAKGKEIIQKQFHQDWNFKVVKTGDTLNLGTIELVFVEAPMLHWPDSMMTYVKGAKVLLSNDAFGQHYATSGFFNDEVDQCELMDEAVTYYANILAPFSRLVKAKIDQLKSLDLPIDVIAPSHGIIWRQNPMQIVDQYYEWAQGYHDGSVVIIYDTMWDNTKKMAQAIAEGIEGVGKPYKLINAAKTEKTHLMADAFKAQGILIGSSTINNGILTPIAGVLNEMKGLKFTNKMAGAFGSFGWSGEAVALIENTLKDAKYEVPVEGLKLKFTPTEEEVEKCRAFGKAFAKSLQ